MAADSAAIRFEDVDPEYLGVNPPQKFIVTLAPGEHVVSVETVRDLTGYARARVWIVRDDAAE